MAEYPRLVRVRVLVYQAGKETQHSLHSMYRKFTKSAATCFAIPHSMVRLRRPWDGRVTYVGKRRFHA